MRLKEKMNMGHFLRAVKSCKGPVYFVTKEGDRLNLKSELTRMIFVTLIDSPDILYSADVICENAEDEKLLQEFLQ